MSRTIFVAAVIGLIPLAAAAHVVRHSSIPQPFWGTWGTDAAQCAGAKDAIVLSGKSYARGTARCSVEDVSETPGPKGSIYSARLQCSTASKTTGTNLVFRPAGNDHISAGPDFRSLIDYQRCPANAPEK